MKNSIKESILEKRNSLSGQDIIEKSQKIHETLFNSDYYKKSKTIMFFVSFSNEINTHEMIKNSLGKKTVVVPKVIGHEIEPSVIIDFENLVPTGKFSIPEPIGTMKIAYKNIDLVLVPAIAYDLEGHRIGYGFGYYDKLLKKLPKALKIGLCFDFQIVDKIPNEEHDVAVDFIITEKRVVECRK